jgi:DNA-binding GntR family transcriptional regulator
MKLPRLDNSPSLTERTYETILAAVQSLTLTPGECVSIQELTNQLGVSRTPLRAALRRLEQDGLVSIVPYKGVCVAPISAKDVEEILELRILLESYAARKATKLLSADELAQAEEIIEQMEKTHTEGELLESATIGHQFHQLLLSKVDNHRLVGFLRQLDTQYRRIRHYSADLRDRGATSIVQHKEMLRALKAGDAERAGKLMAEHLSSVRDDVLWSLFPEGGEQVVIGQGVPDAA